MLTPAFEISQDDEFLVVTIHAPYTKITETEVYFHENDFKFYSKPYFLRLNLPGKVVENGCEKASYDSDKGTFVLHVPKLNYGEHFEGLELITKLLAPRKKFVSCSPIEVLGSDSANCKAVDVDDFEWEIDQIAPDEHLPIENAKYGFANQYSGVVSRLEEELNEVIDVRNPDKKSAFERHEERLKAEAEQFSDNHYLGDLYEDEEIFRLVAYRPSWANLRSQLDESQSLSIDDLVCFTEEEIERMRKLPNKEYLIDRTTRCQLLFSLVDILFAYAYNVRFTEGENNVESVWTLRKLSATLSWFENHRSLEAAVISSARRSLCYPLFRHWSLITVVLTDVQHILALGTKFVVKCLLDIHGLMNATEPHFILNDLYITDYCVWVQTIKSESFQSLAQAIKKLNITKKCVNLDLVELEMGAELALKEGESQDSDDSDDLSTSSCSSLSSGNRDELCTGIGNMSIRNEQIRQSDDDSETDTSDDSTSTDSDDYASSTEENSSNSDDDESTDNSANNLLLKKEKCSERKR